ncbi:response regulator [Paucibacter sp. KCTC 42545]|uniref:response regulator n=1 Tax=Paucibacter sp. KCTC 42545 TaxID=1768242 RepID=UPI003FA6C3DF
MTPEISAPDPIELARPMARLKTYIVEDSPVIRENLIATLEELGPIEVVGTAEDEASAVQWTRQNAQRFDLAIVDIFLKQGSGIGVLTALSAIPGHHTMVVLSNYATSDMRRKCLALGAARVFDKSNEIDDLLDYCCRLAVGDTGRAGLD